MVRLAVRAEEKRDQAVCVLLRPRERRALERIKATRAEQNETASRGSIMREAFLKVFGNEVAEEFRLEQHKETSQEE